MFGFKKKKTKKKNMFAWRLGLSKTLGLAMGLAAAAYILQYAPQLGLGVAAGMVLWFTFEGAMIGMAGVMTTHPIWKSWRMPAWFRGLWIGLFMHLTLFLLLGGSVDWETLIPAWMTYRDPLVLTMIEGAILGMLWDSLITAATGEGKPLIKSL